MKLYIPCKESEAELYVSQYILGAETEFLKSVDLPTEEEIKEAARHDSEDYDGLGRLDRMTEVEESINYWAFYRGVKWITNLLKGDGE